jgi:mono/diheme cytochrome c family protein
MNPGLYIKFLILSLLVLSLSSVLGSAEAWASLNDVDKNAQQTNRFTQMYKDNCSACHGEHGDGKSRAEFGLNPPPRDFTTPQAREELSRERMITSVTYGRPGTAMVGWGKRLQADEIAGIVDYIRATFMQPDAHAQADTARQTETPRQSEIQAKAVQPAPHETTKVHPGQAIYKEHCAVCHGDNGNGATWTTTSLNPPPRNFTAPESRQQLTTERMITSVTFGRPGTAMMPFSSRLTTKQIASVVNFIRSTFMTGDAQGKGAATDDVASAAMPGMGVHPDGAGPPDNMAGHPPMHATAPQTSAVVPADMSQPLPHGLVGDTEKGREFYSANCFTCHGLKGDGRGPRSSSIHPPPRNFLAADSRKTFNRPALFKAISKGKPGTVMPSWAKVLSDQEIANVAEYVFETFIRGTGTTQPDQSSVSASDSQKKKASGY